MKEKNINNKKHLLSIIDNRFKTRNIYYVDKNKYLDLLTFDNPILYDIFSFFTRNLNN